MSVGLQLLRAIIENQSSSLFKELSEEEFLLENEERFSYHFIQDHLKRYKQLPSLSTCETNSLDLPEIDEPANYYLKAFRDRFYYNQIKPVFNSIHKKLVASDYEETKNLIRDLYVTSNEANKYSALSGFASEVEKAKEAYADRYIQSSIAGVTFGFPTIDKYTDGICNGDLITLVGRLGSCKTYLLMRMMLSAVEQNKSVLIVTLEMTKTQLIKRIAALKTRINHTLIRKAGLDMFAKKKYFNALDSLGESNLITFMEGGLLRNKKQSKATTADVERAIEELNPDIVYIDGAYMLYPDTKNRYSSTWERVSDVADDLKSIALTTDTPIVITVQFNRNQKQTTKINAEKELDVADIAGSDNIARASSVVLGIKQGRKNVLEIHGIKNRDEDLFKLELNKIFASMDFSEIGEMADEETSQQDEQDLAITVGDQI